MHYFKYMFDNLGNYISWFHNKKKDPERTDPPESWVCPFFFFFIRGRELPYSLTNLGNIDTVRDSLILSESP